MDLGVPRHFNGSDGQKHGKSKDFKDCCWKKEHSPANFLILFVDLRVSIKIGVSNGKLTLDFLLPTSAYKICDLY